jgi:hypothetical protein
VAQTDRIYRSALSVLIWLGSGSAASHAFLDFVKNAEQEMPSIGRSSTFAGSKEDEHSHQDRILRIGLLEVIRNPYWTRSWIVQELLLAKGISMEMSSHCVSWDSFFRVVDSQGFEITQENLSGAQHMFQVGTAPDDPKKARIPSNLPGWVIYFKDQRCPDPRDRIYAMLGLAAMRNDFAVHYDRSIPKFVECTLALTTFDNILLTSQLAEALGADS